MFGCDERGGRRYVLGDLRGNDFAGTAPGREGVEDDDLVILDGGLKFGLAVSPYVSICSMMNKSVQKLRPTYLARLWTPILTAVDLNPLKKFCLVRRLLVDVDLIVCAVSFDDRTKADIQVL